MEMASACYMIPLGEMETLCFLAWQPSALYRQPCEYVYLSPLLGLLILLCVDGSAHCLGVIEWSALLNSLRLLKGLRCMEPPGLALATQSLRLHGTSLEPLCLALATQSLRFAWDMFGTSVFRNGNAISAFAWDMYWNPYV